MKTAAVTGAPLSTGTRYLNPRRPGEPGERIVISTQPDPWAPHDPPTARQRQHRVT